MSGEQPVVDDAGRELDRIRLTGVEATGWHGLLPDERRDGQRFVADVVVHLDTRRAAARDDLSHSVDYGRLAEEVHAVLAGEPVDLIETLAERVAATVMAHPGVLAVDVVVHKPQAPIQVPFGDVAVEIHRDRRKLPAAEPYRAHAPAPVVVGEPAPTAVVPTRTAAHAAHPRTAPLPMAEVPAVIPLPAPTSSVATAAPTAPMVVPTFADVVGGGGTGPADAASAEGAVPGAAQADVPTGDSSDAPLPVPDDATATTVLPRTPGAPLEQPASVDVLDQRPAIPVDVVIALGSNLGPSQETLREVVAELHQLPGLEVVDVSPLARTAPVGGPDQPDYLDAVVLGRTTLAPRELLHALQLLEDRHGRERHERWGPRTLDLDIVVYGSVLAVTDDLELPHPRAHQRAFVLQPWAQVDPGAVLPGLGGGPVAQLADTAPDRDGVRWMALDWLTAPVQHTGSVDVPARASRPAPGAAPSDAPIFEPSGASSASSGASSSPALEDDEGEPGPAWPWGP